MILMILTVVVWVLVWVFIVKVQGKRGLHVGNVLGCALGGFATFFFVSLIVPEPTQDQNFVAESDTYDLETSYAIMNPDSQTVPSRDLNKLLRLYIDQKIFAGGGVSCVPKRYGKRVMVGCSVPGGSVQIWKYEEGSFYSINETARVIAEAKFSNEPIIKVSPLPLPDDIDVDEVLGLYKNT
ncbi:hypothetical protein [Pseudomonas syringae group sp. J309-1]|uniref:hypothetical protein n=1 Tax=Pseudomonas syringae group sp. J309-1 TaxID=3079588 RepID=UPI00290C4104|nr:hypothetical protein [Pseudomonas syringae group sp. J309-1]MDU8357976.1 hypothetical protein [Pseudomonas syringae group sp. J309-1]